MYRIRKRRIFYSEIKEEEVKWGGVGGGGGDYISPTGKKGTRALTNLSPENYYRFPVNCNLFGVDWLDFRRSSLTLNDDDFADIKWVGWHFGEKPEKRVMRLFQISEV